MATMVVHKIKIEIPKSQSCKLLGCVCPGKVIGQGIRPQFCKPVFKPFLECVKSSRWFLASPEQVILFSQSGCQPGKGLCRVAGGKGNLSNVGWWNFCMVKAGLNRKIGKPHLQFSSAEPLFTDGTDNLIALKKGSARIVTIPEA